MGLVDESMPRLHGGRGLLAVTFGVMAVIVLVALGWSVNPHASVVPWLAVGALLGVLSALTLLLPDRPWTQPAMLAAGMVGLGVLVASCRTAEGMISVSLGLITAAQLAAFSFPPRQAVPLVGFALVVTTVAMADAPATFHPMSWVAVTVVTIASTSLLGYVTHWLRHHATTDDLTGALTRRTLFERVGALLRDAQRTGTPLAVVSADVDDFKAINDTQGHHAGDEVLASLVATWRSTVDGPAAVIGRTGGDEFLLALPGYDEARATAWVERARAVSPAPWSAGVAVARADDAVPGLLRRADDALYATKHARTGAPREQRGG
jgi:diguanylate cyclase (GGDEF)-like protein